MLDPEGRAEVENVLRDIHASGATIIQTSHKLEDVAGADRVLVLSNGSWSWQGRREDFWLEAESLGFELPQMLELRRRLSIRGVSAGETVEEVAEAVMRITDGKPPALRATPFCNGGLKARDSFAPFGKGVAVGRGFAFDIRNLNHSFAPSTPIEMRALRDFSCVIPKGKWTSVLGRTGSGNSTLIQHLNGLYGVQSGEILIENVNAGELVPIPVKGEALRTLRRKVGLVFQSPEDQFFSSTVREELAFAPTNWGVSKEDVDVCVRRALQNVGLGNEYLERSPLRLSGGERRLVAIASVLSSDPECIILDEPTAGLDAEYRGKTVELLSRLRGLGETIVTVTHDLEMAFEQSDYLVVMDEGRKVCEGGADEVLPELLETGALLLPEVVRVSALLRSRGFDAPLTWRAADFLPLFQDGCP
jgi:energy-coupling factor transport system ATP-binding protein